MPTWMKHPRHGRTPAVGAEIEWNQKQGWVIEDPQPKRGELKSEVTERTVLSPKPPFRSGS